ncbi:MAG: response regulator transcription factor [Flavobacterium sp.]|nr:MAG: response regulator transcription factor [Flavobacterium sp.]
MRTNRILIVDDHLLIVEAIRSAVFSVTDNAYIDYAINSSDAKSIILKTLKPYDYIIIDLSIYNASEKRTDTGEEIAQFARQHFHSCELIFITSHVEAIRLYDLRQTFLPSAIVVKSDLNKKTLEVILLQIFNGSSYFSPTALDAIEKLKGVNKYLDNYNRKIISLLSKGIKSKNLPEYLPLSMSAIDKRKIFIKDYFNVSTGTDEDIVREARSAGFI